MKGITFGTFHSYEDLHLILNAKEIGSPNVKTRKIDIEGAHSTLDYTDFFSEPKYEDVKHKFQFSTIVPQSQLLSLFSAVKNALHGKKMRIILDDDPSFYYVGRPHVSSFTNEKGVGIITVEAECEPFKYKLLKTVVIATVTDSMTVSLTNSRKRVVPEVVIETEGNIRIEYKGNVWDLGSGSFTLPELELVEGENPVTLTGAGSITFTYQEGSL